MILSPCTSSNSMMLYGATTSLMFTVARFRFSPSASNSSSTIGGVTGTLLRRMYMRSTPSPPDLIARPNDCVVLIDMKSVIPSARRIVSPLLFIALPKASMYNDIPSSEALKSRVGVPWKAKFWVMSNSREGAVVRFIHPGTSVRKIVAGHQAESSHCICCIIMAPTAEPSRRNCSGTVMSMDISLPRLAWRSTVSGIS